MCGIVGYLGQKDPVPLIVDGLRQLEYRGYDSAGVAYLNAQGELDIFKSTGKLVNLERVLNEACPGFSQQIQALSQPATATEASERRQGNAAVMTRPETNTLKSAIGHIRWATHGAPTQTNAHPHVGERHEIAMVHNGIFENYFDIRAMLQSHGVSMVSETDTECVAQLLEHLAAKEPDMLKVIQEALRQIKGAYALGIISKNHADKIYAVRNQAPLVVGIGRDDTNPEFWIASDALAFAKYTDKVVYLKDNEIVELSPEGLKLFTLDGQPIKPVIEQLNTGPLMIDKKGFKHFMLKEIHEQPDVVRNSLSGRLLAADRPILLASRENDSQEQFDKILGQTKRIVIVACGTSYNAGLVGKYFIEELVRIPVEVESAGEYRYRNPVLDDGTLVIAVSQSGETADTLAALRMSKEQGTKILAITNREDSSVAREADLVLPVRAGVEVSVCATKSFTAQVVVLYLLGLALAETRKTYHPEQLEHLKAELFKLPALIEAALTQTDAIQKLAKKYGHARDILFIARGINFPVALEGALKLKEISYIHAEGYSGSELKHGPIAMLDDTIPVISVLVPGQVFDKIISNCQEAKARDAKLVGVTSAELGEELSKTFDDVLKIPLTHELLSPLITTVPLQLLSYFVAEHLGKDVDQPRNLAKSVTVE